MSKHVCVVAAFCALTATGASAQPAATQDNARTEAVIREALSGYQDALKTLDSKPPDAMAGLYADLRGDILVAMGNHAEARNAYQLALDKSEGGSPYRATVQLKLDALGELK